MGRKPSDTGTIVGVHAAESTRPHPGDLHEESKLPAANDTHWLAKTLLSQRPWSILAAIAMALSFLCNGLLPVMIGNAIDHAVLPQQWQQLLGWMLAICLICLFGMACSYFGLYYAMRSELLVAHHLRMALTRRIQDPRGFAQEQRNSGELLSIASTDAQRVARGVIMTIFPVAEISSVLYALVMMAIIHPYLGLAIAIGAPMLVLIATRMAAPLRRRSQVRQQALATTAGKATDYVQGLRVIKGLAAVSPARRRFANVNKQAYQATIKADAAEVTLGGVTQAAGLIFVGSLALYAGFLTLHGHISLGQLIAAIGLAQFIVTPVTMLGRNVATIWAAASASSTRIREILKADYKNNAAFPHEATATLNELLAPGITVITTTEDNQHHTETIVEILQRFPRTDVTVVPHAAALFSGTVAENIVLPTQAATHQQRIPQALAAAHGTDIPGGAQRQVGEEGKHLSGGQRQRVALARALASDANILVLNEPITAVDSVTATAIAEELASYRKHQPTLIITNSGTLKRVANKQTPAEEFHAQLQQALEQYL